MATREEAARDIANLRKALDGRAEEYRFYIPGWEPQTSEMGLRWMEATLWEGFRVAYLQDPIAKTVRFKAWEHGQDEPGW